MRFHFIAPALLTLGTIVLATTPNTTRIRGVRIDTTGGNDYNLSAAVTPSPNNNVTFTTGDVTSFHLTTDADANGYRITNSGTAVLEGDAITYGDELVTSTLVGTVPNVSLARSRVAGSTRTTIPSAIFGNNQEVRTMDITVQGAKVGMVPVITFEGYPPSNYLTYYVTIPNMHNVRLYYQATTAPSYPYQLPAAPITVAVLN